MIGKQNKTFRRRSQENWEKRTKITWNGKLTEKIQCDHKRDENEKQDEKMSNQVREMQTDDQMRDTTRNYIHIQYS